jgi:hypothetical protein
MALKSILISASTILSSLFRSYLTKSAALVEPKAFARPSSEGVEGALPSKCHPM